MNKHRMLLLLCVVTLLSAPHIQPNTKKITAASLAVTTLLGANAYVAHRKRAQAQKIHSAANTEITKKQWGKAKATFRNARKAAGAAAFVTALLALKAYYDALEINKPGYTTVETAAATTVGTNAATTAQIAAHADTIREMTAKLEAKSAALAATQEEAKRREESEKREKEEKEKREKEEKEKREKEEKEKREREASEKREKEASEKREKEARAKADAQKKAEGFANAAKYLEALVEDRKLGTALRKGNIPDIDRLVAEGVKLNPTHLALAKDKETRQHLIGAHHLDVNGTDAEGTTPLIKLIKEAEKHKPSSQLQEFLTQDGLALDTPNRQGETPLTLAAQANNPFAAQALLAAGAPLDDETYHRLPELIIEALKYSSEKGKATAKDLLDRISPERPIRQSVMALAASSSQHMKDIVNNIAFLIDNNVPYDAALNDKIPDLITAALRVGNESLAELLIAQSREHGADLTQANTRGRSLLMATVEGQNKKLVIDLLRDESVRREINKQDHAHGESALFMGLVSQEITRALLAAGADPNLVDNEGVTPLLRAVLLLDSADSPRTLARSVSVIKELLDFGAEKTPAVLKHFTRIREQKIKRFGNEVTAAAFNEITALLQS